MLKLAERKNGGAYASQTYIVLKILIVCTVAVCIVSCSNPNHNVTLHLPGKYDSTELHLVVPEGWELLKHDMSGNQNKSFETIATISLDTQTILNTPEIALSDISVIDCICIPNKTKKPMKVLAHRYSILFAGGPPMHGYKTYACERVHRTDGFIRINHSAHLSPGRFVCSTYIQKPGEYTVYGLVYTGSYKTYCKQQGKIRQILDSFSFRAPDRRN